MNKKELLELTAKLQVQVDEFADLVAQYQAGTLARVYGETWEEMNPGVNPELATLINQLYSVELATSRLIDHIPDSLGAAEVS